MKTLYVCLTDVGQSFYDYGVPKGMHKDCTPFIIRWGSQKIRYDKMTIEPMDHFFGLYECYWWQGRKIAFCVLEGVTVKNSDGRSMNLTLNNLNGEFEFCVCESM